MTDREWEAFRPGHGGESADPMCEGGTPSGSGLLTNGEGRLSGAKLVLLLPCALAVGWLARDLVGGRELSETHAALLGIMLVVGLVNRLSARGRFRLRLGRDGAEFEGEDGPHGRHIDEM